MAFGQQRNSRSRLAMAHCRSYPTVPSRSLRSNGSDLPTVAEQTGAGQVEGPVPAANGGGQEAVRVTKRRECVRADLACSDWRNSAGTWLGWGFGVRGRLDSLDDVPHNIHGTSWTPWIGR